MLELDPIIAQVKENCDIADANHAGLYSICGLAMRLRDLYKWDMGLEAWMEGSSSEVLAWIGEKERKWDKLAGKPGMLQQWPRPAGSLSATQKFELQELLSAKGFYAGGIDGRIGPNTKKAIKAFQQAQGLAVTGEANQDLLKALRN